MSAVFPPPAADEYAPFYAGYVEQVQEGALLPALAAQPAELAALIARVAAAYEHYKYGPEKWTLRQLFGHLVDGERVFGFRAFTFSRGDENPLPSFDENAYVERAGSDAIALSDHVREFTLLRESNLIALRRLDGEQWRRRGIASGKPVSVRALACIMVGHVRHHLAIVRDRYAAALTR